MKLSNMPTIAGARAIAELADPISHLVQHPVMEQFFNHAQNKDLNVSLAMSAVVSMLPVLLRDNYADTVAIVAVLSGKSVDEINEQPLADTYEDIRHSFDRDLVGVFTSSAKSAPAK
jgi:hypothetical protein